MDDSKLRQISKEKLEKALEKLNKDFIADLPVPPAELLKFATRRDDPVISENISYNLGRSMLEHRLSDEDYLTTFFKVVNFVFANKSPVQNPEATILISQTGAGKTNLREYLLKQNSNRVIINSDQYKRFRPDVQQILEEDPTHFGALTGIDCYDHARNVNDFAIAQKYNLLIECAPTLSQGLVGVNLDKLKADGYDINFHVMSVGDLVSALAIHYRYEQDILEGRHDGSTKLTDINRHDESYKAVENVIKTIDPKKITIYRRGSNEENRVPIEIQDNDKTVLSNLRILNTERDRSNQIYVSGTGEQSFKSDYDIILNSMRSRNAPEPQFSQLNGIYEKYLSFIARGITPVD